MVVMLIFNHLIYFGVIHAPYAPLSIVEHLPTVILLLLICPTHVFTELFRWAKEIVDVRNEEHHCRFFAALYYFIWHLYVTTLVCRGLVFRAVASGGAGGGSCPPRPAQLIDYSSRTLRCTLRAHIISASVREGCGH